MDKNVKVYHLNYKGWWDLLRLLIDIRTIIKDNNYDLIHSHLSPAGLYTQIARPSNIPQIHTIHSTYSLNKRKRKFLINFLERNFFFEKKSARIIVISEFNRSDILNKLNVKGKIYTLNNFIEDIYFKNPSSKKVREKNCLKLIAIGNLRDEKNYEYLIEVFKFLKNKNIYLDIFGFGNAEKYQQLLDKYGIINITFKGGASNIYDVIRSYDLFIMASKFEGFGLSVFEAMVSEVPVMLSDIPSLKSIVKDHALYFTLNDPEAVANELIKILNNEIDPQALAEDAKKYAESIVKREIYIHKLLNIYNEVINDAGKA